MIRIYMLCAYIYDIQWMSLYICTIETYVHIYVYIMFSRHSKDSTARHPLDLAEVIFGLWHVVFTLMVCFRRCWKAFDRKRAPNTNQVTEWRLRRWSSSTTMHLRCRCLLWWTTWARPPTAKVHRMTKTQTRLANKWWI